MTPHINIHVHQESVHWKSLLKCIIQPPGNHASEPNRTTSSVNRESNRRQRTRFSMHRDESFHHYRLTDLSLEPFTNLRLLESS